MRSRAAAFHGSSAKAEWTGICGLLLLAAAWLGPLPGHAQHDFVAHMALHVTVVCVAAPLLAFGIAASRADPVRYWPAAFAPLPASLVDLVVVWAWHAPALHMAARSSPALFVAEQASFLGAGLLLWLSVFGGEQRERTARAGAGIIGLLLTSMHMTVLGVLLTLAPRPLYEHAGEAAAVLADQRLGGLLMLLGGGTVYLFGGLLLLAGLLRRVPPRAEEA